MKKAAICLLVTLGLGMATSVRADNLWEDLKFSGDVRFRYENIDKEGQNTQDRNRIRARVGLFGKVSEYSSMGIQLASGSIDPVSTNQTLDNAGSTKQIGLDLAYLELHHPALAGFMLRAGKIKNPFVRPAGSELQWDPDWNPEGGALTLEKECHEVELKLVGAGLWIEERSTQKDAYLLGGQGSARYHFGTTGPIATIGGGYNFYDNVRWFPTFLQKPNGNSTMLSGRDFIYTTPFEIAVLFGELSGNLGGQPVTVMGHYVNNTAIDSLNSGWMAGLHVGKAKKVGSWSLRYFYRHVEKDAVLGLFTDSDAGGGGTDNKGHEIGGSIVLARNTAFEVTYFINDIGLEDTNPISYKRLQVDLQLKL